MASLERGYVKQCQYVNGFKGVLSTFERRDPMNY